MREPETLNPYATPAEAAPQEDIHATKLLADRSFWGLTLTQFLGAFNDNVYKTTLMLLFVAVPLGVYKDGQVLTRDLQGEGTFLFALPFLLFSGLAGYLSDRYSKRWVIFLCKLAEVLIMAAGLALFAVYGTGPMSLAMAGMFSVVLFCMGTHSAFFGPGKYGVLPELFRERDLPLANGIILMTTFLAIIFGVALAGVLKDAFEGRLWVVGVVCIGIALAGVLSSLLIRETPAVRSKMPFALDMLLVPKEMRLLLGQEPALHLALWVSSLFWMTAAMVQNAVTALGKLQLKAGDTNTSLLVAVISLGIVVGSPLAGIISKGHFHTGLLKAGAWGLTLCLVALAIPGPANGQLLGYWGSMACLAVLGICTGLFAVPLQVFLQAKPPRELKGRMIATMNLLNFFGITLAGLAYAAVAKAFEALGQPPSMTFAVTAAMMGVVAIFYHPREAAASDEQATA